MAGWSSSAGGWRRPGVLWSALTGDDVLAAPVVVFFERKVVVQEETQQNEC